MPAINNDTDTSNSHRITAIQNSFVRVFGGNGTSALVTIAVAIAPIVAPHTGGMPVELFKYQPGEKNRT
jgi:hypothetical protein